MPEPTNDREPPFFVVGTGRSGTTLLQAMLMSHPSVRIPPETQYFDHLDPRRLGFEDPVPDGDVERYLKRALSERAVLFLDAVPGTSAAFAEAVRSGLRSAREQLVWLCDLMTADQSGARVGEKTPQHWSHLDRIIQLFPEARVIHLCRDPRDTVAGLLEMDWWGYRSVRRTAVYWMQALTDAMARTETLGDERHRIVRYEDLVTDPESTLRDLCGVLGLDFDPMMLDHRSAAGQAFGSRESGYKGMARDKLSTDRLGRYRKKLTPDEIRLVESVVGTELMSSLGYERDTQIGRFGLAAALGPLYPGVVKLGESVGLGSKRWKTPPERA